MAQSFRDLQVWQRAMQLCLQVYRLTQKFPKTEIYGLTSQMRRAAVSVPSNIAEGHGRGNPAELRRFLAIARGSLCELQTQLAIAGEMGMGEVNKIEEASKTSHETGKMFYSLMQSLRNQLDGTDG